MNSIPTPTSNLASTRTALHRLAAYVIAPTRYAATERFGLRATTNGFGTPEFDGRRIRVEGRELIDERPAGDVRRTEITSLAAAAAFLDAEIDPTTAAESDSPALGDVDADLAIDEESSLLLGAWFENAFAALVRVRADAGSVGGSEPQLWPGHFDPAIEVGDEDHRGSYGASPGDGAIDEPYLYLSIWWPDRLAIDDTDPFWNSPTFKGRVLRLSEFPADVAHEDVAYEFWTSARDHLPD